MKIAIIAAVAANNTIGIDNKMPWHIPGELGYFKQVTMGKPIIMGRNTFESLGRPLPGRTNIVITRNKGYEHPGIKVVHTLDQALALANEISQADGQDEIMVIGGAQIYAQALPLTHRLYLTRVERDFAGDTFFPELDLNQWQELSRDDHITADEQALSYSYQVLERTS